VNTAFQVVTGIGFIICLVFVIAFHIKTGGAWRRSEAGRWLMLGRSNFVMLFGLLLLAYASSRFRLWEGTQWIFLGAYTVFALQNLWPLRLLWHEDRIARIKKEGSHDSRP
jgi:Ca2+/Na+ antiporter